MFRILTSLCQRHFPRRAALALLSVLLTASLVAHAHAIDPGSSLLPVTDAFRLSARIDSPGVVKLHWTIAPHYYLYRGRIKVKPLDANAQLGVLQLPNGLKEHDPYLGDVEIYHDSLDATQSYTFARTAPQTLRLSVTYQGCHEVDPKICYPPHTQTIELPAADGGAISLPNASVAPRGSLGAALQTMQRSTPLQLSSANANAPEQANPQTATITKASSNAQSDEQKLAARIGGHGFAAIALFFGFGLLLSFTPCVLPMIPILSGLIVGSGEKLSTARAFVLSLTYVLASCVVFTIAGVVAGVAGANLSAWMQQPAILIAFAILFVLLALSMFGLYELQLPSSWQARLANFSNRQRGGSLLGVAVMGVLSALIVGPCVAPPLAAAVLYIGQNHDPVFGGAALFALSLGMGVPLLVIGTGAGTLLPRSGAWMNVVKAIFGVLFLGVAIYMLSRVLEPRWILLLTGALLIGCATVLAVTSKTAAALWRGIALALAVITVILGASELVGAAAGSRNVLQPLAGVLGQRAPAQTLAFRPVKSVADVDRAIAAASAAGQPAMLDFYADWCVSCKEMEALTLARPDVQRALADFVLLRADVTANDADDQALLKRYGLFGPPADLFFGKDGRERRAARLIGYENADVFLKRVHEVNP